MALQAPVNVSPLIRGARWAFLVSGFLYGSMRLSLLKRGERRRLDELERTRPEREAKIELEKKMKLEAEIRELENIISPATKA
ncbi:hypothetical protein RUM44_001304 [Polyplax serrata]|uniref:ATP synthase F(0) complex subunit e, mitochondrial n=1 Tax=Polyplax serrata TaxID=468196 RepID=A0ABR1AJN0_POLSC